MISRFFKKAFVWKKIVRNYFFFKKKVTNKKLPATKNSSVFFYLKDIRQEPYYYPILFSFDQAGYLVLLADNLKFIGHSFASARFIFDLPGVSIVKKPFGDTTIFITDDEAYFKNCQRTNKAILLKSGVAINGVKDRCFLPYPMHPNAYHSGYYKKVEFLREAKKKFRILFSGNTEPTAYSNPIIQEKFKKLNRIEVINSLIEKLPPEKLRIIKAKGDLPKKDLNYFDGAVFYLWEWSPEKSCGLEIRVGNDRWHDFLASGEFFLCCPGIVIPQSHNAIEAMSVGTIPILQYAELFHPHLIHGTNCISFNSKDDLGYQMNQVLNMDIGKINEMRENVIDYYDKYLSHQRPAKLIEELPLGKHEVYFYNETVNGI